MQAHLHRVGGQEVGKELGSELQGCSAAQHSVRSMARHARGCTQRPSLAHSIMRRAIIQSCRRGVEASKRGASEGKQQSSARPPGAGIPPAPPETNHSFFSHLQHGALEHQAVHQDGGQHVIRQHAQLEREDAGQGCRAGRGGEASGSGEERVSEWARARA